LLAEAVQRTAPGLLEAHSTVPEERLVLDLISVHDLCCYSRSQYFEREVGIAEVEQSVLSREPRLSNLQRQLAEMKLNTARTGARLLYRILASSGAGVPAV
jgi:hypothetical protein